MSYTGTVRCSYCGGRGHNKLGCPERRKKALADPNSWVGRQWHAEQEERKRQIASRVCTYCKEPGHNRRGCKLLKEDSGLILKRQRQYMDDFALVSSTHGLGIGALVKVPRARSHDPEGAFARGTLEMVTAIHWDQVDFLLKDTDINRNWRGRDKQLIQTRVVSSFGYDEDDNGWHRPPRHNDIGHLRVHQLMGVVPEVFYMSGDESEHERVKSESCVVVSPSHAALSVPELSDVPYGLQQAFNLKPDKRADEWDRRRVKIANTSWSKVRPAAHEKALAEIKHESKW